MFINASFLVEYSEKSQKEFSNTTASFGFAILHKFIDYSKIWICIENADSLLAGPFRS